MAPTVGTGHHRPCSPVPRLDQGLGEAASEVVAADGLARGRSDTRHGGEVVARPRVPARHDGPRAAVPGLDQGPVGTKVGKPTVRGPDGHARTRRDARHALELVVPLSSVGAGQDRPSRAVPGLDQGPERATAGPVEAHSHTRAGRDARDPGERVIDRSRDTRAGDERPGVTACLGRTRGDRQRERQQPHTHHASRRQPPVSRCRLFQITATGGNEFHQDTPHHVSLRLALRRYDWCNRLSTGIDSIVVPLGSA